MIVITLLILIAFLLCYLVVTRAIRDFEKNKAIKLFHQNSIEFETVYSSMLRYSSAYTNSTNFSNLLNGIRHFSVPEGLKTINIDEIFESNNNFFFQFEFQVLNIVPHGYVYINEPERIPSWYKLTNIVGNWYYYYLPS